MKMFNPTNDALTIRELGITCKAKGTCEVPDAYCIPRKGANGDPVKPIIAMLAPQLEPADEDKVDAYKANKLTDGLAPEPPPPTTARDLMVTGMAPAVAETMASGKGEAAPKITKK